MPVLCHLKYLARPPRACSLQEVGATLNEVSSLGLHAIFERFRAILHEVCCICTQPHSLQQPISLHPTPTQCSIAQVNPVRTNPAGAPTLALFSPYTAPKATQNRPAPLSSAPPHTTPPSYHNPMQYCPLRSSGVAALKR